MYDFSLVSFIAGLGILLLGILFVRWHRVIAEHLGGGISSYDKYRLWALIICGLGLLTMLDLPRLLLNLLLGQFFGR